MTEITTVGLDLAKNVFQMHAVDAVGAVVVRRQVRRAQMLSFFSRLPPSLFGMEACAVLACCRFRGHEDKVVTKGTGAWI